MVEKPEESKLIVILSGFGINSVMTKLLPCCRIKYGQSISFCTTPPRRTISPLNSRAVVCPVQIWQSVPVRYPPKHSKSNVCACPFCSATKAINTTIHFAFFIAIPYFCKRYSAPNYLIFHARNRPRFRVFYFISNIETLASYTVSASVPV